MSDLVQRLREAGRQRPLPTSNWCLEAANALEAKDAEIARLREALSKITSVDQRYDWSYSYDGPAGRVARAALEPR